MKSLPLNKETVSELKDIVVAVCSIGSAIVCITLFVTGGLNSSQAKADQAISKNSELEGRVNRLSDGYKSLDSKIDTINEKVSTVKADGTATRAMVEIILQRVERK